MNVTATIDNVIASAKRNTEGAISALEDAKAHVVNLEELLLSARKDATRFEREVRDLSTVRDSLQSKLSEVAKKLKAAPGADVVSVAHACRAIVDRSDDDEISKLTAERDEARAQIPTLQGCIDRLQEQIKNAGVTISSHLPSFEQHKRTQTENRQLKGRVSNLEQEVKAQSERYRALKESGAGAPARREIARLRARLDVFMPLLAECRAFKQHAARVTMSGESLGRPGSNDFVCDLVKAFDAATAQIVQTPAPRAPEPTWFTRAADRVADAVIRAIESPPPAMHPHQIAIVFDGPPGPESGRFVEVEDSKGRSLNVGEWAERGDGLWELRILRYGTAEQLTSAQGRASRAEERLIEEQRKVAEAKIQCSKAQSECDARERTIRAAQARLDSAAGTRNMGLSGAVDTVCWLVREAEAKLNAEIDAPPTGGLMGAVDRAVTFIKATRK